MSHNNVRAIIISQLYKNRLLFNLQMYKIYEEIKFDSFSHKSNLKYDDFKYILYVHNTKNINMESDKI